MKRQVQHPAPTARELSGPRYWRSLDELAATPGFQEYLEREFPAGAPQRHRGGEIQRQAILHLFDGLAAGQHIGLGAPTPGEAEATEGKRSGHQLEELAAVDAVELRRARRKLALKVLLESRR